MAKHGEHEPFGANWETIDEYRARLGGPDANGRRLVFGSALSAANAAFNAGVHLGKSALQAVAAAIPSITGLGNCSINGCEVCITSSWLNGCIDPLKILRDAWNAAKQGVEAAYRLASDAANLLVSLRDHCPTTAVPPSRVRVRTKRVARPRSTCAQVHCPPSTCTRRSSKGSRTSWRRC